MDAAQERFRLLRRGDRVGLLERRERRIERPEFAVALGEEPETLLVEDLPLLVTVAVWAAACAVILALGSGG